MSRKILYRVVNSCAPGPFTGNPICVIAEEPEEALMQPIATQMNLACTIFPVRTGERSYRMRLFTSEREVAYAGSPSLAAAWVMGPGIWTQTTPGNVADIEVTGDMAWLEQPQPKFAEINDPEVLEAIGLKSLERMYTCQVASNHYVIAVTQQEPTTFTPRQDILMRSAIKYGPALIGAVRRVNETEVHARFFGPAHGVPEDPACGAVAGAVGTLMHRNYGTGTNIALRQGEEMGRPSRISVSLDGGKIRMGGRLVPMQEGVLSLS